MASIIFMLSFGFNLVMGAVAGVSVVQKMGSEIKLAVAFLLWAIGVVTTVMFYGYYAFQNPALGIKLAPQVFEYLIFSTLSFVLGMALGSGIVIVAQK